MAHTAAREELDSGDDARLLYAALQLRMAIEALIYERQYSRRDFLPIEQVSAWQPRDVLRALLEIDDAADKGGTLFMARENPDGSPAEAPVFIGAEHVLSLKTIKTHYDALGSFLHLPTLKQSVEGKVPDMSKLRVRCEEIATEIQKNLNSSMRNIVIGSEPRSFECEGCGATVTRKLPLRPFDYVIRCNCGAEHRVCSVDGNTATRIPLVQVLPCVKHGCDGKHRIWRFEIKDGTRWNCETCNTEQGLALGLVEVVADGDTKAG